MVAKKDILDYVLNTPYNTNRQILGYMLDEFGKGGGPTDIVVKVATTAQWESDPSFVAEKNIVYVYTDAYTNGAGEPIPAFKVGNGRARLSDLPFNDAIDQEHVQNTQIHITNDERNRWDSKVTAYVNPLDAEDLIFN